MVIVDRFTFLWGRLSFPRRWPVEKPERVRIAGLKMSNWLYNMAQTDILKNQKNQKNKMNEMVRDWDREKPIISSCRAEET